MRLLTILPALTLILATLNAMAYNSKNCAEKIIYQSAVKQKNFSAYMGQATIGSSSSSTSYVSSTGPCKAFGQIRYERTYMIANAWGELKGQAAKGSGEHLQALSSLYGCNSQDQFSKFVNSHYSQI